MSTDNKSDSARFLVLSLKDQSYQIVGTGRPMFYEAAESLAAMQSKSIESVCVIAELVIKVEYKVVADKF